VAALDDAVLSAATHEPEQEMLFEVAVTKDLAGCLANTLSNSRRSAPGSLQFRARTQ